MLAFNGGYWSEGWFHAKLLLVLGLSGYHGWLIGYFKKLKRGERPLSEKRLRLLNEVRTEEHTSELQSLMRYSYAVFCLKKKNLHINTQHSNTVMTIIVNNTDV